VKHFTLISLFPEFVDAFRRTGIVGRCRDRSLVDIETINPRDFAVDRRGTVDDAPYGGGPGMVMTVAPLRDAIRAARARVPGPAQVIYLTPQGEPFTQRIIPEFECYEHLILLAGRYEGIDERVVERYVDREISIGDFVVSGGELPAMLIVDALTRRLPGALGDPQSAEQDSFVDGLLDHPHYTRPESIDGDSVPGVLLSGDHAAIARWRRRERLLRTQRRRPDLLLGLDLSADDRDLLAAATGDADAD
jgi:tRNA (guanine37-N1)-methyltransferase